MQNILATLFNNLIVLMIQKRIPFSIVIVGNANDLIWPRHRWWLAGEMIPNGRTFQVSINKYVVCMYCTNTAFPESSSSHGKTSSVSPLAPTKRLWDLVFAVGGRGLYLVGSSLWRMCWAKRLVNNMGMGMPMRFKSPSAGITTR